MNFQIWIALAVGAAATVEDLWRHRISNWIPAAAFVCGVAYHTVEGGGWGALSAMLGAVSGFAVFLVFYWLGGMGGGDVKLMSGFGALLGSARLLEAALWTSACGGVMALAVLAVSALRGVSRGNLRGAIAAPKAIPYAPAITAGVWLSLVPKG
jgi:prepilin peptidase CpaA